MSDGFDFLFGSWRVQHRMRRRWLSACEEWDEFEGGAACAPILNGIGNFDQIEIPSRNAVGATLRLFDRSTELWSIHWVSSLTGRLDPVMKGSFSNGMGVFHGIDEHAATPVLIRFVWDSITATSARWSQAFTVPGTDSWEINWITFFTRISTQTHAASTEGVCRG
jgi:hypothetical protein